MIRKYYSRIRFYGLISILLILLVVTSCAKKEPVVEWKGISIDNIFTVKVPVSMSLQRAFIQKLDGHNLYSGEYKNKGFGFYYDYGEYFRKDMFDVFTNGEPKYEKTTRLINGRNAIIFSYQARKSKSLIERAFSLPSDRENNVTLIFYFPATNENKTATALYFWGKGDKDFELANKIAHSVIFP